MKKKKFILVIPARYDSSRFPGKPLAIIKGPDGKEISLIERTWKLAKKIKEIDKNCYKNYSDQFLKTPKSPNLPLWEIFTEHLKNNYKF